MDIFRINEKIDRLTTNLEQTYPLFTDLTQPIARIALIILPIAVAVLYSKLFSIGWSLIEPLHLFVPGSETEYSLGYLLLFVPLMCLVSISLILSSCWAIRNLNLTDKNSVIDLISALIILMILGWCLPTINSETLKVLSVITADRATVLSAVYYISVALTFAFCHWPRQLQGSKSFV
ncbi:hypothetical protein [Spirosoma endophyticum]|uniref:Uncharacterized protein n=1 Tax=Spirosoma endophyticum TaxID=662367 RepID=A0A1I2F9H1_9BACT|nr:hypothetical protein [Spirosoma endophyticum]SFF01683.1 hypothetical protein SAMN05216167_1254 [Spirosoma endophyticum]